MRISTLFLPVGPFTGRFATGSLADRSTIGRKTTMPDPDARNAVLVSTPGVRRGLERADGSPPEFSVVCRLPRISDWWEDSFLQAAAELARLGEASAVSSRGTWAKSIALRTIRLLQQSIGLESCLVVAAGVDPLCVALSRSLPRVVLSDIYRDRWPQSPSDFPADPRKYLPAFDAGRMPSFVRASAVVLPFRSHSFDVIVCLGPSINWFGSERRVESALSEMARLVSPKGMVLATLEFDVRHPKVPSRFGFSGPAGRAAVALSRLIEASVSPGRMFHIDSLETVRRLLSSAGLAPLRDIDVSLGDLETVLPVHGFFRRARPSAGSTDVLVRPKTIAGGTLSAYSFAPLFLTCRAIQ